MRESAYITTLDHEQPYERLLVSIDQYSFSSGDIPN